LKKKYYVTELEVPFRKKQGVGETRRRASIRKVPLPRKKNVPSSGPWKRDAPLRVQEKRKDLLQNQVEDVSAEDVGASQRRGH